MCHPELKVRILLYMAIVALLPSGPGAFAQDLKPGVPGMAPTKWITVKNTHAPGRVFQCLNNDARTYTQEDIYIKAWIPVVMKSRFSMAIGPHYRSELLELKDFPSHDDRLASWRLRAIGVDMKSFARLDSTSWLIFTGNVSQSGNINDHPITHVPLTYTFSTTYLRKRSINKEIGFGLMVNKANSLLVLPVFVYNHTFSAKQGVEISLPHKVAWRFNVTPTDRFYLKAEANTRTYFISNTIDRNFSQFRRIDVDMGVSYNKQFAGFMGAELFMGYRQNLASRLPHDVIAVKNSGFAGSLEVYIRPPQGLLAGRKK